jgi:hypothetical protein
VSRVAVQAWAGAVGGAPGLMRIAGGAQLRQLHDGAPLKKIAEGVLHPPSVGDTPRKHTFQPPNPSPLRARIALPEWSFPELPAKTPSFLHIFSANARSSRFKVNGAFSFEL